MAENLEDTLSRETKFKDLVATVAELHLRLMQQGEAIAKRLLCDGKELQQSYKKILLESEINISKIEEKLLEEKTKRQQKYVPLSSIRFKNAVFALYEDFEQAYRDASMLRAFVKDGKVMANPYDVRRLGIASIYVPEVDVMAQFLKARKIYKKDSIMKKLSAIGFEPILYNGKDVFPPTTMEIAVTELDKLQVIGIIVRDYVQKYGTYISSSDIESRIGKFFFKNDLMQRYNRLRINSAFVNNMLSFNIFDFVINYPVEAERLRN